MYYLYLVLYYIYLVLYPATACSPNSGACCVWVERSINNSWTSIHSQGILLNLLLSLLFVFVSIVVLVLTTTNNCANSSWKSIHNPGIQCFVVVVEC